MKIKWVDQKNDIELSSLAELYSKINFCESIPIINKEIHVWIEKKCFEGIYTHLKTSKKELGGLLIGSVYSDDEINFNYGLIHVKNNIVSTEFTNSGVSLSMSPDVWNRANEVTDNNNFVLGWYHSHPNLGAFFSSIDKYTQSNFFPNNYNLGLVVDPYNEEQKIFINKHSLEIQKEHITIV